MPDPYTGLVPGRCVSGEARLDRLLRSWVELDRPGKVSVGVLKEDQLADPGHRYFALHDGFQPKTFSSKWQARAVSSALIAKCARLLGIRP